MLELGSVEQNAWLADSRLTRSINVFAAEFVVRYMSGAAALFAGDYDCAMIFLALLGASGGQIFRDPSFRAEYSALETSVPVELSKPVSRQAIARSVGLSRETVRRKVAKLVAEGFIVEDPRGGVIITRGVTGEPAFVRAQEQATIFVRQFLNDLREFAAPLEG